MRRFIILLAFFSFSYSQVCDLNNDDSLDVLDIVIMVTSILDGGEGYCDLNDDNQLNVLDVVQLLHEILHEIDIEFVEIPAGSFVMPGSNETTAIEYDFKIGKHEITNQEYLQYLNSAINTNEIWIADCIDNIGDSCVNGYYESSGGVIEKSFFVLGNPNQHMLRYYGYGEINFIDNEFEIDDALYLGHPVVNVTWFGATHFSEYYGYRLPKYSEWVRAARDDSNASWPFTGVSYSEMHLVINVLNSQYNLPEGFEHPWSDGTTPVDFYQEQNSMIDNSSPFGAYDMIGNASEWISDTVEYNQDIKLSVGAGWDWGLYNSRLKWHTKYTQGESSWSSGFRVVKD